MTEPTKGKRKATGATAVKKTKDTVAAVSLIGAHQLEPHPALARMSLAPEVAATLSREHHGDASRKERAEDLTTEWAAWVEEIREHGIREPLRIVPRDSKDAIPRYWVIDGRHRLAAATEAGLISLPTLLSTEAELPALAVGSVTGRRHWTKSQRAFFAVLMNPEIAAEGRNGKIGKNRSAENAGLTTQPELAARFGVSERLLRDAIELYRLLETYPNFKPRIEPSLWGGASLAGLLQGLRAMSDTSTPSGPGSKPLRHPPIKIIFAWRSEKAHAAHWDQLSEEQRSMLGTDLERSLRDMPADYVAWRLDIMQRALSDD